MGDGSVGVYRVNGHRVAPVGLEDVPAAADVDEVRAAGAVAELLAALGVPLSEHHAHTPRRVARAFALAVRGYQLDPARHLDVTFPMTGPPGLVMVAGIRVVSTCAHHLLPIVGRATVAYRPAVGAPIVGLSKLARVVEEYAARLQVQEQLTADVVAAVAGGLDVDGAGCVISAEHGCMTLRGVGQAGTVTTTAAWRGDAWTPDSPDVAAVWAEHRDTRRG